MQCRVCGSLALIKMLDFTAPSVTSICTQLDVDTVAYLCPTCSHVQSPDLPDSAEFYDQTYRISLSSDDHDQILTGANGKPTYRTMLQAEITARRLPLVEGAAVLDFGSGKATTLRRLADLRPDIDCYVFDVSQDYASSWEKWLIPEKMASYAPPRAWQNRMDAVTLNFVLEHVSDLKSTVQIIISLLKPNGYVFAIVPDFLSNPVDLLVVDHVNHFTAESLDAAFAAAGMTRYYLSVNDELPNSIVAIYQLVDDRKMYNDPFADTSRLAQVEMDIEKIARFWEIARSKLQNQVASLSIKCRFAIFGAGVYGSLIHSALGRQTSVVCFLDNNPSLMGTIKEQIPVLSPSDIPDCITHVIMGVNPKIAEEVFSSSTLASRPETTLIFLDR